MLKALVNEERMRLIAPRKKLTDKVLDRLVAYQEQPTNDGLQDEQVWTLLFTYGFVALPGQPEEGLSTLGNALTQGTFGAGPPAQAWLEMQPLPPRQGVYGKAESNTEIDLAVGDLEIRAGTETGIKFRGGSGAGRVCLVEAKWLSDIASKTKHDHSRNQLARVIETGLTFQNQAVNPALPGAVHVTLLTPSCFRVGGDCGSRLYFYKFREYSAALKNYEPGSQHLPSILWDIRQAEIPKRQSSTAWRYPDLAERLPVLKLHWVTYEELFQAMPASEFKTALQEFIQDEPRAILEPAMPGA